MQNPTRDRTSLSVLGVALALAALVSPVRAQLSPITRAGVTLQVVALDGSRLANGQLELNQGQSASLELRATDATGKAMDLKSTAVTWQSGNATVLSVQPATFRATVGGRVAGQATLTVAALGQTATVRTTVGATANATTAQTSSLPTIAKPVATPVVATRVGDPCAMGTPSPLLHQPCVRKVTPDSAAIGMSVYIKGTGFTGTSTTAGGMRGNVVSDTVILLIVNSGTPNTNVPIVVTNPSSGNTSTGSFKVLPTRVVSFSPKEGRAGDRVSITGYGFATGGLPGVMFADGHNSPVSQVGDGTGTSAVATVPPGDVTGHIWVSGAKSTDEFVELPSLDPTPTDLFVPPNGGFTITGKALQNVTAVTLGSQPLTITSKTYTLLSLSLPAPFQQAQSSVAYGQANVTYRNGNGGTYVALAGPKITVQVQPQILSITPDSGTACDQATVQGKALINAPNGASATPAVQLGAVSSPYASGSDVAVSFFVPKLATTGPLTVIGYNRRW